MNESWHCHDMTVEGLNCCRAICIHVYCFSKRWPNVTGSYVPRANSRFGNEPSLNDVMKAVSTLHYNSTVLIV
jgi:hypothetical protein